MRANDSISGPVDPGIEIIERQLSYTVVGCFFEVYNTLGFGFLESIYSRSMHYALSSRGLRVDREYPVTVYFKGREVGHQRIDMLVERRIIVEIKSSERLNYIAMRQLRNYLTATNLRLGLLLHFGPRAQIHRVLANQRRLDDR